MTLYRGQKSRYDGYPFVPDLLRSKDNNSKITQLEEGIMKDTKVPTLEPYKQMLSGYSKTICPSLFLYKELAEKDHLYYFFLSMVNIGLQSAKNSVFGHYPSGYFDLFLINKKNGEFTLPDPDHVLGSIDSLLYIESMFDGERLKNYSVFQHLNFVFPGKFPTLLLDWTSDISIAAFFSMDEAGKLGTVVSIEYPNELFIQPLCHFPGTGNTMTHETVFYNTTGYICDHYDCGCENKTVNMPNGRQYHRQVNNHFHGFNQSLITLQKATCLYWPYKLTLADWETKYSDALGFRRLSAEEVLELC